MTFSPQSDDYIKAFIIVVCDLFLRFRLERERERSLFLVFVPLLVFCGAFRREYYVVFSRAFDFGLMVISKYLYVGLFLWYETTTRIYKGNDDDDDDDNDDPCCTITNNE